MPAPSRDRLSRPVDISTMFQGAARRVDLIVDEPGLRYLGLTRYPNEGGSNVASVDGHRGGFGYGRNFQRFPRVGQENGTPVRHGGSSVRGRGSGNVLPRWYPRTPLRDITQHLRTIERRREVVVVDEHPPTENVTSEIGSSTPLPTILMKPQPSPSSTQAIRLQIVDPYFFTPEKKLLDSIEKVREIWLKEQQKMERTPAAKKAERDKKVRVLLSMR